MLIIIGKSASGKTSILNKLVVKYGFKPCVAYTTRPIRDNEADGKTYHFISNEEFKTKINEVFFVEYQKYTTIYGDWYYGTPKSFFKHSHRKSVAILTPQGLIDAKRCFSEEQWSDFKVIYVYANNKTIKERLNERGDNKDEIDRRINADNKDFKEAHMLANKIVYNNSGANLDDIVLKIVEEYLLLLKADEVNKESRCI